LRKELIVILLISLIYSLIAVPVVNAEDCVKISVQDSRGVRYANFDIYAQMDILGAPDYIGKAGKDGWLSWCDYISAPLGFPYQLVAQEDGCQRGSTIVFLFTGKPMNIVIPKTNEKCDDVGGINFTSIKLGYISVNEDDSGDLNFDYIFRAQKANGTSVGIGFNNASSLSLNAFITGLSVPNNKFWVNLGPDEPDRIIDDQLRESEVGRIMLEADLQMKRDFAKYTCAHETDNASMDRLLAEKKNSLVQQCMDKFPGEIKDLTNVHFTHTIRYWIVPDKIYAYINGSEIFIINATLTINSVVEEPHFRLSEQNPAMISDTCRDELNKSVEEYSEYDREIEESAITPHVIKDINYGDKYESLREVYVALALAQWYKSNFAPADILRNSLESSNLLHSTAITPWTPTDIWGRYMDSIKNNDERCTWWFNTTTKTASGTINKTILRSRGGVRFRNIIDQIITIDEMPSELQNQVKMAITSAVIDEEDYVLLGNRLHLDSIQNASIAGVLPLSNVTQPDPELARVWFNKGRDLDDLGKYEEAIEAYDEAIRLNPNYAKAWFNKGLSLDDLGKHDEAVKAYDEAIRLDPNNAAMAWNNKAISLGDLGKYDEAIEAYDEAIKLDPNYAKAWNNKGLALRKLDRTEEAEAAFAKAEDMGYSK
jgi:tetratricopeptide (TPR) repeat protein